MRRVEFRLEADSLTCDAAPHPRRIVDADRAQFAAWTTAYRAIARGKGNEPTLLVLGREIAAWLDADQHWLTALRNDPASPTIAEFATTARPGAPERQFLEVPWELAAVGENFLAAEPTIMWAPLRRLGPRHPPQAPDHSHRLGMMFMAAAPLGQHGLNFEAEEAAILHATQRAGLDLYIEETGTLKELAAAWDRVHSLDALHLSCRGTGGEHAFLALEDDIGDLQRATLADLALAFPARHPRLLFLSACHSGEVHSLALGLVQAGLPTVLGWPDSVNDTDASIFAADFYAHAARRGVTVEEAWAAARSHLLQPRSNGPPPRWHLARLCLGPTGGGNLVSGGEARTSADMDAGRKAVIRARGAQIKVASRFEFVGRREQMQGILREFRHPGDHAGVLIDGLGRQGKSSLAARLIDRLPHLIPVVLFQRCDGTSLLAEIAERVPEAGPLCDEYRSLVGADSEALYRALRALLTGPCKSADSGKPILLLLDDFEALLDLPSGGGQWHVKPEIAQSFAAVIRAFDQGGTDSRLLLTCRCQFDCYVGVRNYARRRLLPIHLHAMSESDARKQANQKLLSAGPWHAPSVADYRDLAEQAIIASRGNTGLRDLLFQAALADRNTGERAIAGVAAHFTGGVAPDDDRLHARLETLAIERLVAPLSDDEKILLCLPTLFNLPLPLSVWRGFATEAGLGSPDRLLALGLWQRLPDIVDPHVDATTINAIAATRLGDLQHPPPPKQFLAPLLVRLFTAWGANVRATRPAIADIELTHLALQAGNLDVLVATAEYAIHGVAAEFDYHGAANIAASALDALTAAKVRPSAALLRAAAEAFARIGDLEP